LTMHRLKLMPLGDVLEAGRTGLRLPNWGMPGCEVELKFSGGKRCILARNLRLLRERHLGVCLSLRVR